MGIKGSATCVLNFDEAVGYMIGPKNKGLSQMFTMMNLERIIVGVQGLGISEIVARPGPAPVARDTRRRTIKSIVKSMF